jgi:SHO1 osmosensor
VSRLPFASPKGTHVLFQIVWTLYFTAEEGSLTLHIMNTFGTGGLTGPGRRRTVVGGGGIARSPSNGYIGGVIGATPYSPPAAQSYGGGGGGFGNMAMGLGNQAVSQENKSQYSVAPPSHRPADARSLGGQSIGGQSGPQTEKRLGSPTSGVGVGPGPGGMNGGGADNPNAALMPMPMPMAQPASPPNAPTDAGNTEVSQYRARALYACG